MKRKEGTDKKKGDNTVSWRKLLKRREEKGVS